MAKASPLIRSFNGGEVSNLIYSRTDLEKYPASARRLYNAVAAPQGPAICRSGTLFVGEAYSHDKKSVLVPFVFDEEEQGQVYTLEFTHLKLRFFSDDGLLVYAPVAATGTGTLPFTFTSAALSALGAVVGDQVVLGGYANSYNLNGVCANITAKSGDDYTIDAEYPPLSLDSSITVSLVYSIASPYTEDDIEYIRDLQSLDVVYLFHFNRSKIPYKLKRNDTYDWEFEAVDFTDGPYMDVNEEATSLTPNATGSHVPFMTSNSLPAGSTAFGGGNAAGKEYYKAFDAGDTSSYWQSSAVQTGYLGYQSSVAFICDGYSISLATDNSDTTYTVKDFAPSTFTLSGSNDGTNYTVLDSKVNYVLYDSNKSLFFNIQNNTAYAYYKLDVKSLTRNGNQPVRIHRLALRSTTSKAITLTASSTVGINNGQGFLATDVGRLIRVRGIDGSWRPLKITARTSSTVVVTELLGEPLSSLDPLTQWRLGHWSDTTGYPGCGVFHQDRLWMGGSNVFPDLLVASSSQAYEDMTPTEPDGTVLDTNAITRRLNSRRMSRIKALAEGDKGLMVFTGSREWIVSSVGGDGKTITPNNIEARRASTRGSANVEPVPIDNQVVYIQRSGRTAREFAFVYDVDGFKSPIMSLLSSHLGASPFVQMAYAAEPYSIIWMRRANGSVVGMTYNRDESVVGWHSHEFSDGIVENICVIPSADNLQDTLWMVVRRNILGVSKRYIEKLTRFWDFGMAKEQAHFVDSALLYSGVPTDVVFGLSHLEGKEVYGLADGNPVGPFTVEDGSIALTSEASEIIIGLGYDSEGETTGLENGAQDGTALGKEKRIHAVCLEVWDSFGGEIGSWNEDTQEIVYEPIEYVERADIIEDISLFSGTLGPVIMQPGYEKRGSVSFRRKRNVPLPLNIISISPQLVTQDRT